MKKLALLSFFVLGTLLQVSAQSRILEKSFSLDRDKKIHLNLRFGETISVNSWDKNEVAFKAIIEINNGKLNDALELDFDSTDGLKIVSDYNEERLKAGHRQDCPDPYSRYSWSADSDDDGYIVCSKISYELWMPKDVDLNIESISGDIELVGLTGPIRAKSISGYVDVSWPAEKSANISIKTISGEAFTDLDNLHFKNKKSHITIVGYTLKGAIGTGGSKVSLESVSGNVYLRKANS